MKPMKQKRKRTWHRILVVNMFTYCCNGNNIIENEGEKKISMAEEERIYITK